MNEHWLCLSASLICCQAMANELDLIAVIAKGLADLKVSVRTLSKQEGPRGPKGDKGDDGRDGIDGKDGRDGIDGKDGKDGKDGRDGIDGKDGKDGKDGTKGEKGDPPDHKWDGTKLSFQHPDGSWGKKVDVRGPKGEVGSSKVIVAGVGAETSGLPSAVGYPGKTLVWDQGNLSEVLFYSDAGKNKLAERRVLTHEGGKLTSIAFFDGSANLTKTRTLEYSGDVLIGVTEA